MKAQNFVLLQFRAFSGSQREFLIYFDAVSLSVGRKTVI
jgi:hypothetical protein